MSQIDVRGLLQYVPQFKGKTFVIVIDVPHANLAETMLDLLALQNIGVKLVLGSSLHGIDEIFDRAAEVELKYAQEPFVLKPDASMSDDLALVLGRGQAALVDFSGQEPLSTSQAALAVELGASKFILLQAGSGAAEQGAIRAADLGKRESLDPLLSRAEAACQLGVDRVHLLNGSFPAVLLNELFSNEGVGTMVYADSYRGIRPIREEDIVELLGMIGRSVRNSRLVPRTYADIEQHLEDYSVMDIDGNVVGCVALLRYAGADTAEVACLYVKQAHEGLGYGAELVTYAEQQARELGLASVFSLTNRAAHFFQDRMGYEEWDAAAIPQVRSQQLLASGRDSRVFGKLL
ncbi:GNAT family N-acetyltransferase [Verrucomicrobiaceae bacterium N1E253]|uniref:GNAT family N-acetyltransferase n=1 Tax=Oceaniferula marina TaxID=2748318 RepID=A0A851GF53_9BACT|nr:GNAT family N-acetyltransferase [Oceaniferula marina]NWK56378.1 GNAT family N-acetyltransferase [Oceaniferula marina]